MRVDTEGLYHGILVLGVGYDDGILVESEGADYARYSALIPNARQIMFMEQRYNCIQDLESALMSAADEMISCANAYDGDGDYRVLIADLAGEHGFDERYIPLLSDMLNEHSSINEVVVFSDEIVISIKRQEKAQRTEALSGPSPRPYNPERMEQLPDTALDLIGGSERGMELYNTLKNAIGMTDEEIQSAGFELEQFSEPQDDGIKMD